MVKFLCHLGLHSYGTKRGWRWSGLDSWHWVKKCQRCGKEKRIKGFFDFPPSEFVVDEHGVYRERLLPGYKHEDYI